MYMDHGILYTRDIHLEPVLRSSCVLDLPHRGIREIRFDSFPRSLWGIKPVECLKLLVYDSYIPAAVI